MEGVTLSKGWGVSFTTILSQNGETLHNHTHHQIITPEQKDIYDIVESCNELAFSLTAGTWQPSHGKRVITSSEASGLRMMCW